MTFPIDSVNQRDFPADWSGEVFTCDIDRTYLMTRFSSLKGMARIPFEFAVDKTAIEGMTTVLKEVRRGPAARSRQTPIYFVSASPSQLRSVIERKMLLDGLEFDGTTFKDWVGVALSWRFERFREQLGFKLTALLARRMQLPAEAREVLIGDDLELDALAFCLYADVLAGRLAAEPLLALLARRGVADDDAAGIVELKQRASDHPRGVKRAYIRLERHAPEHFLPYAPHLVACEGSLQLALGLWADESISLDGALRVAQELVASRRRAAPGRAGLGLELQGCCRRGLLDAQRGAEARAALAGAGLVDAALELPAVEPAWVTQGRRDDPFWTPAAER